MDKESASHWRAVAGLNVETSEDVHLTHRFTMEVNIPFKKAGRAGCGF